MLTWFYIVFYVAVFTAVIFQDVLIYKTWAVILLNASVWIPQIAHSYAIRSRRGPSMQLACSLTATQVFMPLYIMIDTENFLNQETDYVSAMFVILFLALQLFIIRRQ